jgi:hypothetical protein
MPRLMDEKAALKLVLAIMIRAAGRWCPVSVTDLERHQLRLLRAEVGLDSGWTPRQQQPNPKPPQGGRRMINRSTVYRIARGAA